MTRWLLAFFVFAGLWFAPAGEAAAGCTQIQNAYTFQCSTREEAYAGAASHIGAEFPPYTAYCSVSTRPAMVEGPVTGQTSDPNNGSYNSGNVRCTGGGIVSSGSWLYYYTSGCPAGTTWKESLHKCFSPEECVARNSEPHMQGQLYTAPYLSRCDAGCTLEFGSDAQCTTVGGIGGGAKLCSGTLKYTGDVCDPVPPTPPETDPPPPDPEKKQECMAAGSGQTYCQKPDGEQCYSASTGRQICWDPGETGEKTDGPVKQKRDAGTEAIPPNLNLNNGDTLTKTGESVTTTTTISNSRTITTTTTNYTTTNGSNAGGSGKSDSGQKADGSELGDGKDKDGKSAGDSGNCDTPPSCEGDAIACLQARYQWKIQCNTGSNEITNGTGCEEGDVPICAGKNCKAEAYATLLQNWRSRCAAQKLREGVEAHAGEGDGDDGQGSILIGDGGEGDGFTPNEDLISYSGGELGWSFDVNGQHFSMPQQLLDWLPALRWLVITLAALAAIAIIRGE